MSSTIKVIFFLWVERPNPSANIMKQKTIEKITHSNCKIDFWLYSLECTYMIFKKKTECKDMMRNKGNNKSSAYDYKL